MATTKNRRFENRKEPSADAAIYDLLEEGAKYEVVDEEQIRFSEDQEITADWVAVNYGGKTGYKFLGICPGGFVKSITERRLSR